MTPIIERQKARGSKLLWRLGLVTRGTYLSAMESYRATHNDLVEARADLNEVDLVLARRPALDGLSRLEKIVKTVSTAKQVEELEPANRRLRSAVDELNSRLAANEELLKDAWARSPEPETFKNVVELERRTKNAEARCRQLEKGEPPLPGNVDGIKEALQRADNKQATEIKFRRVKERATELAVNAKEISEYLNRMAGEEGRSNEDAARLASAAQALFDPQYRANLIPLTEKPEGEDHRRGTLGEGQV